MRMLLLIWQSLAVSFRCLVVDDNRRFLEAAQRSLERQGLEAIDTAIDIRSALEAVAVGRPDVVLIDVSLGQESGFDLIGLLAERFTELTGRMIVISTRAEEDYVDLIEDTAAAGFLSKSAISVAAIRRLVPGLPGDRPPPEGSDRC
jgi:DNA-binding NarL/FixJ family response regulator